METKFLFDTAFELFWSEFGDFDGVDNHGIRAMSFGG